MHVAHIIDLLLVGGAQKLLVTLAEAVQARDVQLSVISLRRDDSPIKPELEARGARVLELPGRGLLDPLRLRRLVRLARRQRFDVIHTHLTYANVVGTLAGQLAGIPVIASLHNVQDDPRHSHPIRRQLETWALRYGARRIVAVGHVVAEAHRARLGGRPIDVIPNAVAILPSISPNERISVRTEIAGDPNRPLLIAVSRLTPQKGHGDLLMAFAALRQAHPQAALAIVGGGTHEVDVRAQIAALNLDGHVFLLGRRKNVSLLLAAGDIFVSASHWEGLPVALLEAMAAGLPVVATDVGEVPRVVVNGTGLLVPPRAPDQFATALRPLLDDPSYRQRLGTAARTHVACHYSSGVWADRLLALYESAQKRAGAKQTDSKAEFARR